MLPEKSESLFFFKNGRIVKFSGKRVNSVSEGCSEKFHKYIRKTSMMGHFLRKVADLQPESFQLKSDCETFQNSFSVENFGMTASLSCAVQIRQVIKRNSIIYCKAFVKHRDKVFLI